MASTGIMQQKEREAALASMDPDLKKERAVIEKLLNDGEKNDVLNKWDIGKHVAKIKSKSKWGDGAVAQIAQSLPHVAKTTLDAYHRLATAWPTREAMSKLLSSAAAKNYHFGVTHLLAIAGLDSEKQREKLVAAAVKESLSKNDLITRVQNLKGGPTSNRAGKGAKSARPVSPRAGLQQLATVMRTVQEREKVLSEVVFDPLKESAPADWDDELVGSLETALNEVHSAQSAITILEKSLASAIKRGENVMAARKRKKPGSGGEENMADEEEDEELEDDEEADDEEEESDDDVEAEADEEEADEEDEEDVVDDVDAEADDDDEDDDLDEAMPPRPARISGQSSKSKAAEAIRNAKKRKKPLKA